MKPFHFGTTDINRLVAKRDIRNLLTALGSEDKDLRWMAAGGLGELRDQKAVEPLMQALSDSDPDVRWKAAEALGSIGDSRATDALIPLLQDPDGTMRLQVIWALGKIRDPRATAHIIRCLPDADHDIRIATIWALGNVGDQHASAALQEKLLDPHPGIRSKAAESLETCGWKPNDTREIGVFAFARRDWKEVSRHRRHLIDVLVWALNDEYFDVRMRAAKILGETRSPHAVVHLERALDDPVEAVSYEAAAALAEIGDVGSIRALIHGLESTFLIPEK